MTEDNRPVERRGGTREGAGRKKNPVESDDPTYKKGRISLYLLPADARIISELAEKAGMKKAEYVRNVIMDRINNNTPTEAIESIQKDVKRILAILE
jgi:hypothetical protein